MKNMSTHKYEIPGEHSQADGEGTGWSTAFLLIVRMLPSLTL